jgi:hypothetical protein
MANKPNNPSLWSKAKSLAKQKFDVYPSAYANGWAAKWYKSKGGTWSKSAEYGMEVMEDGGIPDNEGFKALPFNVQQKIINNMEYGGYMPQMPGGGIYYSDYATPMYAKGGMPCYECGGMYEDGGEPQNAGFQALPNYVQEKILNRMDEGGEPNGGMALGQIMAVADKMNQLSKFISPDQNLDPWIASKLAVMDDSAAAIADYMMYNPEAKEEGEEENEMDEMKNGGYTVRRSNERKGKTHVVIGPDGTKKYFGDSNLGQHPKDPERKKAFYARHASNLKNNPYFRAYAKATWEDGGQYEDGGIHIDPSKKGTFKAQATRMGMSVQEAASHIMANKEDFSPAMVKKAVFAHNFANQFGGIVDENDKYRNGGDIQLPKAQTGLEFLIPMAINAIGSAGAAGAAGAGAGAAAGAGSGSALAGAAAKGIGSQLLGKAGNSQNTQSGGAGKFFGAAGKFYDKSSEIASNSPDITSYNLANASMLPDEGYLSGLKGMIGLGTALSNVAGTVTQPFAGASLFAKNAGKSNLQVPAPPVRAQKMGAVEKQTIPDYSGINDTQSFKNYSGFMPQLNTFQQGMPLKTQVGPVAEFNNGGSLPRFQGVDEFGNFTTSIVNPGMTGINLGQSLYNNSAVGQQANTLGTQLPQVQSAIQNGYDPAKNLYQNSEVGQQSQELKQENPFASGLNKVGSEQSEAPAGLPPGFGSMTGPGMNRTMGFISGMNMFNSVLEARQNKKARKKWERENMNNSDSTINPTVVESPFGLYDPNTGVLKPANKVATQDFGTTGVARQGGQKMYREGGTYMLDKNEIMRILAAGGEIEFI